jgi:hypothetical protein
VDVCAIFHLDSLCQTLHKSPEFSLYVIFGLPSVGVQDRVERHSWGKIILLEIVRLFLKLPQRVNTTLLKAVLASPYKTFGTMPIAIGDRGKGRIETLHVISVLTAVTRKNRWAIVALATIFTSLKTASVWPHQE